MSFTLQLDQLRQHHLYLQRFSIYKDFDFTGNRTQDLKVYALTCGSNCNVKLISCLKYPYMDPPFTEILNIDGVVLISLIEITATWKVCNFSEPGDHRPVLKQIYIILPFSEDLLMKMQ